ncbi:MAG: RedB protein [Candidatus Omnitrophica bacterium]|nr:RedB protein [Candidatus Omnitrophota bacterium]
MMVHPHCACSRASLGELERLLAQSAGKAKAHVVFLKPGQFPDSWVNTDTWRRAKSLPDVEVVDDVDGAEAKLFSATTSGQTFLYDSKGRLIFSGGITGARGHEGDNKGRSTIVDWLNHGTLAVKETFVFGCSLFATGQEENN